MTEIDNPTAITSPGDLPISFPLSRRERPAKPALTRAKIISAALAIVREEGVARVTMRRLAADLDTGPASLYVYVRNIDDLYAQILDALLAPIAPIGSAGSWRERLIALVTSFTAVLSDYPQMARLSLTTRPSGANYLAIMESILTLLSEGGVPNRGAAWAVDLLLAFATTSAVESTAAVENTTALESPTSPVEPAAAAKVSALDAAIGAVSSERYPYLSTLGSDIVSGGGSERFVWGVNVIINGVMSTPRPRL